MSNRERPEPANPELGVLESGPMPQQTEYTKYCMLRNFNWQGLRLYGKFGDSVEEVCAGGGVSGFYEKERVIDWDYDIGQLCNGQRISMAKVR